MAVSTFILRVELYNPDENDYTMLHENMALISFFRAYNSGAEWLDLPTATYTCSTSNTLTVLQDAAQVESQVAHTLHTFIASKPINHAGVAKDYIYFLSKFEYGAYKLNENTDVSKRPY